jgi:hypothetical protein
MDAVLSVKGSSMSTEPVTSGSLMVARSYWMMFGPALLFILAFQITRGDNGWFSTVDGVFLIGLGAILFARWFEFHKGAPLDSYGEPAKPGDLGRFVVRALFIGLGVWIVAKLIGNFWPN